MNKITQLSTFTYKGQDFDVLINNGAISYIFEIGSERYGNKVVLKSKKTKDIVDGVFNLIINFIDTYEAATKG